MGYGELSPGLVGADFGLSEAGGFEAVWGDAFTLFDLFRPSGQHDRSLHRRYLTDLHRPAVVLEHRRPLHNRPNNSNPRTCHAPCNARRRSPDIPETQTRILTPQRDRPHYTPTRCNTPQHAGRILRPDRSTQTNDHHQKLDYHPLRRHRQINADGRSPSRFDHRTPKRHRQINADDRPPPEFYNLD